MGLDSFIDIIYRKIKQGVAKKRVISYILFVLKKARKWIIMSRKEVTVSEVANKHDNPIAELVQVACQFDSNIVLESENRKINAKSIMGIMAFNPSKGMTVNIVADGVDEEEAILAMEKFLVCD